MAGPYRKIPALTQQQIDNFWSKVDRRGPDDCWDWKGCTTDSTPDGYGIFSIDRKAYRASRVAYFIDHGKDPGALLTCHTCDRRRCCNPSHLFLGTHKDNTGDCVAKGRLNSASGDNQGYRKHPEVVPRGDTHWTHTAKSTKDYPRLFFTVSSVRKIRAEYAAFGGSKAALARKYGVTANAMVSMLARRTWKHVA